jgi:hypothetical protein
MMRHLKKREGGEVWNMYLVTEIYNSCRYWVLCVSSTMKREGERFEIFTYFVKSTIGVDTGCCVLVVQWEERERGLKYLLTSWNLQQL